MNWPLQSDITGLHALFGNPDPHNRGVPDPQWEHDHLTKIVPPYTMYYGTQPIHTITCNKAIAGPLLQALNGILAFYKTPVALAAVGLDQYSGCYNFRSKRLGMSLSQHAYAAAIDIDAAHNAQRGHTHRMPKEAVEIFKANGAIWGGDWTPKYVDPMHFQWARV